MEPSNDRFRWRETSPGAWERDLDEVERFWNQAARLHDSNGRRPFEITGHLSLVFEVHANSPEEASQQVHSALQKTWIALRYDHPTLASKIDYIHETERFYKTYRAMKDITERQAWLDSTLVTVPEARSGIEFANSDPAAPDYATLFIIDRGTKTHKAGTFEVGRDLVLRASHSTIDGAGTLLLMGNLLRIANTTLEEGSSYQLPATDGSETANLSPAYRIAANIPPIPSPEIQKRIDQMYARNIHFGGSSGYNHLPALGVPFRNKHIRAPGKHQRVDIVIPRATTSKILASSKSLGATVTHVFHAAIPIAMGDLQELQPDKRRFRFTLDLLYNERSFCSEPYNTAAHAVAAYHSGSSQATHLEIILPASDAQPPAEEQKRERFSRVLEQIRDFYTSVRNDKDQGQLAPYIWSGFLKNLPKVPRSPPPGPAPSDSPTVTISSLGKVDSIIPTQVGQIRVKNPWVTGEEMSNQFGLFLITHDGELNLAAAYNEAWHDESDALAFLHRCKALVLEFLDVVE
ncbi:beta-glucosidase [Paramyrothecium foliicola]|nr:beta-glucosidase [Paramyrothecium foliicola]